MNRSGKPGMLGAHRTEEAQKKAQEAAQQKAAQEAAEKKAAQEAAQKNAMREIGSPGMVGLGPGQNLQQKTLLGVQKDFKVVLDYLKGHPRPDEATIKGFIAQLKGVKSDVAKLKGAVPNLEQNYNLALSSLQNAEAAFKPAKDEGKLNREVLIVRNSIQKIVDSKIG
jgi:hypothetical protein